MTPDDPRRRSSAADDLATRARRVAWGAYRRAGRLGRRVLGADPAAAPAPLPGPDVDVPPWLPLLDGGGRVLCNVCRWQGEAFDGSAHVELALCPRCGSNGRDRFLHWCLAQRVELGPALRVIECSPRMGDGYRAAMGTWFFYRTSDYDLRAHAGNLRLDLQAIDLPDACVDVLLCAHVLEHVPDTDKALAELHRVVAPGGHLLLQVPVLQGRTAPPGEPEFHGDDTPVFWRFGFDLTARLRPAPTAWPTTSSWSPIARRRPASASSPATSTSPGTAGCRPDRVSRRSAARCRALGPIGSITAWLWWTPGDGTRSRSSAPGRPVSFAMSEWS
jgi:SAM-dependent methyltransferase